MNSVHNDYDPITTRLAQSGPTGVAAAAAVVTAKKRKRGHQFELNPSIRKRQQTRLLRKLKQTMDEYTARVGHQACVVIANPGKTQGNFKVFGARPLENVLRQCKPLVMQELDTALTIHNQTQKQEDPNLHELPPLTVDGIPTPVEKMTQAQLRAFIPLMLKYSTGRGKPGWGKDTTRPVWWPQDLPWANVRSDARSEDEKNGKSEKQVSWTHALRQIVINCYKFHNREDLLPAFNEDEERAQVAAAATATSNGSGVVNVVTGQQLPQGTNVTTNGPTIVTAQVLTTGGQPIATKKVKAQRNISQNQIVNHTGINLANTNIPITTVPITADGTQLVQGVNVYQHHLNFTNVGNGQILQINGDGNLQVVQCLQSLQVDQNGMIVGADGTTQQIRTVRLQAPDQGGVHTLAEVATGQELRVVNIAQPTEGGKFSLAEASFGPDGNIILTTEDGTQNAFPVAQIVPIQMYDGQAVLTTDGSSIMQTIAAPTTTTIEGDVDEDVKIVINGQNQIIATNGGE